MRPSQTKAIASPSWVREPLGAMKENLWLTPVTCLAFCVDKEHWKAIDYRKEQGRVPLPPHLL